MTTTAAVSEIYASVQGEGPYTGERQIFLRLAGCPLRCRYCDTPGSLSARGHPRMTVPQALKEISKLRSRGKTVSITGGEPLVNAGFLRELLPELKKRKFRVYLETAGVHPSALKTLMPWIDTVSMDMKLPSATGRSYWKEHEEFVRAGGEKVFVKIVLERNSKPSEIKKAVSILSSTRQRPLLVIQPVTPISSAEEAPTAEQISDAYAWASAHLPKVLVMTQQHKVWDVR